MVELEFLARIALNDQHKDLRHSTSPPPPPPPLPTLQQLGYYSPTSSRGSSRCGRDSASPSPFSSPALSYTTASTTTITTPSKPTRRVLSSSPLLHHHPYKSRSTPVPRKMVEWDDHMRPYHPFRSRSMPPPPPPAPRPHSPGWTQNCFYPAGTTVWYAGTIWRCDAPHTSGALAREPPVSPHLWSPAYPPPSSSHGPPSPYDLSTRPRIGASLSPGLGRSMSVGSFTSWDSGAGIEGARDARARLMALREDPEFARDRSYLRDELLGARVWRVGGVGAFAYAEDTEVERVRQSAFREYTADNGREDWLHAARARTAAYANAEANGGIVPLLRWVIVESWAPIPHDALPIGHEEDGHVLYASRVWFDGGLHIGKAGDHLAVRCATSVEGRVHSAPTFEVLCGSLDTVEWVPVEPGQLAVFPGLQPVEAGRQRDGRAIFVARAEHHKSVQPGNCLVDDDHASIPYESREDRLESYEVLTYATTHRR